MRITPLRVGRIGYLNVWPLFDPLHADFPDSETIRYDSGHPSALNAALREGGVDMAPASAFAYLENPLPFSLLPDLSICAAEGPIQSVLFITPVPLEELGGETRRIQLSKASASSNALLKTLWRYAWKLPEPEWVMAEPGHGPASGLPFVEIGDLALRRYHNPPEGWHVVDMGQAWKAFTGLPFVFALWIVRRGLTGEPRRTLGRMARALRGYKADLSAITARLAASDERPDWISREAMAGYFDVVRYDLGPREQASLVLFANYCREQGLIKAVPELSWFDVGN